MDSKTRLADNGSTGRLCGLTGIFLVLALMMIASCSSSSDTRNQAQESTSGEFKINAVIGSPTDGATIAFYLEDPTDPASGTTDAMFTAFATGGTGTYTFQWTIQGRTTTTTADGDEPDVIQLMEYGPQRVTLTVTDSSGIVGTDVSNINVVFGGGNDLTATIVSPPIRRIFAPYEPILFSATVNGGSGSYAYLWEPSDPSAADKPFDQTAVATFSFWKPGTYTMRLTIKDNRLGITTEATLTFTITSS